MATIEKRQYRNKENGKIVTRYKAKIRLRAFPYEEATFDRKTDAQELAAKRVRISMNIYQEGSPVFDSDVSGFNVGKYKPKQ